MPSELLEHTISFIRSIGIPVQYDTLTGDTFLPGLLIDKGGIIIDPGHLQYPGDLLHEAGHIAVVPARDRSTLSAETIGNRKEHAAEEMMAIAWSYAACKYLGIDPYIVFHEEGYQGGGKEIADQFEAGHYFGVPMLQYYGLARRSSDDGAPYPAMIKWLR